VVTDDAEFERHTGMLAVTERGGTPESGTGTTTSTSTWLSRASCAPKAFRTS